MSVKFKIAIYNTFLASIITIVVLIFMFSMSSSVVESSTRTQLKFVIHENASQVEFDHGELELEDVNFYENHIYTLVYSHDGYHLAGSIPQQEAFDAPLLHGQVTPFTVDGVNYLIYDTLVSDREHDGVFLRGIVSLVEVGDTVETLFFLTTLALPVFLLFAGLGSYYISKHSLKPLEKIIQTAQDISNGQELARRIDLGPGKDEVHQLADTFNQMFSQLEQAFLAEKQFSSDVSHELRTPVAVILAQCECNLKGEASPQELEQALFSIQGQGRKMQQIINSLLGLIRMDSGQQKAQLEDVDFSELLTLVCQEQESLLPEDRKILTQIPPEILCRVDYSMMIRVLSNLIDNGLKYGKPGGYVRVTLEDHGDQIWFTVEDDGMGIPADQQPLVFQRFYQVDTARQDQVTQSMGLGLAMVAQIVKLHQGTITLESVFGLGSVFRVKIPKNLEDKEEEKKNLDE